MNPLRYRGYYYDTETGFYYLQSRYYDPAIGRFINADALASTGQSILGYNMYAYCNNNPVMLSDPQGYAAGWTNTVAICDGGSSSKLDIIKSYARICGQYLKKAHQYVNNSDIEVVQNNNVAFYKGKLIITVPETKLPFIDDSGFSCGVIFLGNHSKSERIIRHEYGHTQQLDRIGMISYLRYVVTPSVICFATDTFVVSLNNQYYNLPWEYVADVFGGVNRNHPNWVVDLADTYWTITEFLSFLS